MNAGNDKAAAADRFGAVAQRFCSVVDSASTTDRTGLLLEIYRVLPELIGEAIRLPAIELSGNDDQAEPAGRPGPPKSLRQRHQQWEHLYNLLKEKLGDWNLYWQVFDPTKDKEAIYGSLADDIADIYGDLKKGHDLKEKHQAMPENAIWMWRFSFHSHWGKHAIEALGVIHCRLEDVLA